MANETNPFELMDRTILDQWRGSLKLMESVTKLEFVAAASQIGTRPPPSAASVDENGLRTPWITIEPSRTMSGWEILNLLISAVPFLPSILVIRMLLPWMRVGRQVPGVDSIATYLKESKVTETVTLTGNIDLVNVVGKLRKSFWRTEIVTVGPATALEKKLDLMPAVGEVSVLVSGIWCWDEKLEREIEMGWEAGQQFGNY
ncbi:hypothetical protein LINPERHAP2_LOCUS40998 [Linum perenne]